MGKKMINDVGNVVGGGDDGGEVTRLSVGVVCGGDQWWYAWKVMVNGVVVWRG